MGPDIIGLTCDTAATFLVIQQAGPPWEWPAAAITGAGKLLMEW